MVEAEPGEPKRYPDHVVKQARALWASGYFTDEGEVEQSLGLPTGQVRYWRQSALPDGVDWQEFREMWMGQSSMLIAWKGPNVDLSVRRYMAEFAVQVMDMAQRTLVNEPLFDEDGQVVGHLYNASGQRVPLSGLRATTFPQVVDAMARGSQVLERQLDAMGGLEQAERMREQITLEVVRSLMEHVDFTKRQASQLQDVLARLNVSEEAAAEATAEKESAEEPDEESTEE